MCRDVDHIGSCAKQGHIQLTVLLTSTIKDSGTDSQASHGKAPSVLTALENRNGSE